MILSLNSYLEFIFKNIWRQGQGSIFKTCLIVLPKENYDNAIVQEKIIFIKYIK